MKKYHRDDAYIGEKPKLSNLQRYFQKNGRQIEEIKVINIRMIYTDQQKE